MTNIIPTTYDTILRIIDHQEQGELTHLVILSGVQPDNQQPQSFTVTEHTAQAIINLVRSLSNEDRPMLRSSISQVSVSRIDNYTAEFHFQRPISPYR